MWNLYELLRVETNCQTIVAIVSESLSYRLRQSFRLMCLLYKLSLDLKLISVSNMICEQSYDQYVRSLSARLMDQNVDSSDISADNFETLIDTSIALSLLTTRPSIVISRVEPYLNEATFIQYNCGRLKAIIDRYDREYVANGVDAARDLSLLTHDLEWTLVFHNLSKYRSIIAASDDLNATFSQLVLFLKEFVRDVSVYYKKVKILTEPSAHLRG
ncbi:unnamed protein product [Medioppia subpectinata]|uniref:DALR anticodon binding domain-containing protein n=1 Tax=Medioppia subpectinata TaxID=1979941 RepID=A0A7R9LB04_9ACAR|nr:unnamed protein product [Medioppia subpectinata]CAG2117384.1 unnamed protein product [Medioppia subpectinata]